MRRPLAGLESVLADEDCDRVELHGPSGEISLVFLRQDGDTWATNDPESAVLHTEKLMAQVGREFGPTYERLVCVLGAEHVVYTVEGDAVRVKREVRPATSRADESAQEGLRAVADALGIPRSKRKAKFRQAYQFARIVEGALARQRGDHVRILDLACGRSYLGFVLTHLLSVGGQRVLLHGVDSDPALVDKCHAIAEALAWTNASFEAADLGAYSVKTDDYDMAVALHACDTLTDEAIRIAVEARIPVLFAAPCCQHEFRYSWKDHQLQWISRYGLLEQRLTDVVTDGFRCLVLEALGYQVKVIRFAEPDITPKNLLIQARSTSRLRPERARAAEAFLKQFKVRPRLAALLGRTKG
ncbi:MAG: class I SAM-dependent methyltransferase [Planctomycetota bacterium]|jgi:SAM-dependent methyltransferase